MSTLTQGLLKNLAGEIDPIGRAYLSADEAYLKYKIITGQDFGREIKRWCQWFKDNPVGRPKNAPKSE